MSTEIKVDQLQLGEDLSKTRGIPGVDEKRNDLAGLLGDSSFSNLAVHQIVDPRSLSGQERPSELMLMLDDGTQALADNLSVALSQRAIEEAEKGTTALFRFFAGSLSVVTSGLRDKLGDQSSLFAKMQKEGNANMLIDAELSTKMGELMIFLDTVAKGNLPSEDISRTVDKTAKGAGAVKGAFSKIKGFWGQSQIAVANSFADDSKRMQALDQRKPEVDSIVDNIKGFPARAIENMNMYLSMRAMLVSLKSVIDGEVRERVKGDKKLAENTRKVMEKDIGNMIEDIEYFVGLLDLVVNINLNLIDESGELWRNLELKYVRAFFTSMLAVFQSGETQSIKTGLELLRRLSAIENAAVSSIVSGAKDIDSAMTAFQKDKVTFISGINGMVDSLNAQIEKSDKKRALSSTDLGTEIGKFQNSVANLGATVRTRGTDILLEDKTGE